jgi:hypothetical protein
MWTGGEKVTWDQVDEFRLQLLMIAVAFFPAYRKSEMPYSSASLRSVMPLKAAQI